MPSVFRIAAILQATHFIAVLREKFLCAECQLSGTSEDSWKDDIWRISDRQELGRLRIVGFRLILTLTAAYGICTAIN